MSMIYRNIIKLDLASRVMSLQVPALFSGAHDVKYFTSEEGKMLLSNVSNQLQLQANSID